MNDVAAAASPYTQREILINGLYEAAELEHNLMCTYLYAAASLKEGEAEGLSAVEAAAVKRWRQVLLSVAIQEMGHLAEVWNITSALGASPRLGRANFPLDPGYLPAGITVKLAPFSAATLQHFVFLERPYGSSEPEGAGFACERPYVRGTDRPHLTPMGRDYETVGVFYATLGDGLRAFVARYGEADAFGGDPALQLSTDEVNLPGVRPVRCLKTALAAFSAIIEQGEGAPRDSVDSHYQKFLGVRADLETLTARNPAFAPAFPAATNPVLRRPPRPEGRVWIEDADAFATVDLANASYALMLRLLAYAYVLRGPDAEKSLAVDLAIGLMQAVMPLAERAARLPAGPSNPHCNAGVSFITLRDPSPLPPGRAARRLLLERLGQLGETASALRAGGDARALAAADRLGALAAQAQRGFDLSAATTVAGASVASGPASSAAAVPAASAAPATTAAGNAPATGTADGVETVRGDKIEVEFEAQRCIHSRFCVTWAPQVFLANVKGPWIHPDAMPVERLVDVAHACPSGAIRYRRLDGAADEAAPPVNLAGVREGGPYAFRAELQIAGAPAGFRATLCRCGASKNKPYCDNSHHEIGFNASGEPPSGKTDMLPMRDGVLAIDPQTNGPLRVRGNLEITSGTGRVVARVTSTYLCRCGGSATKPFCDGTHAKIGFTAAGS
ncbi:MAG TPA: ferritin-like domain-containing protein [Steroidobacteraceae bacterium]|nr:ferritin-like domain-containing protein [Steroidobacteraceae bacterium]